MSTCSEHPTESVHPKDPLPSWTKSDVKSSLVDFVARVTDRESPDFVPERERIAVFDNDGTLCTEQPLYAQFAFGRDRVRKLVTKHPEWREKQPFKAALQDDPDALGATGIRGLTEILSGTHVGDPVEDLVRNAGEWLQTARHPAWNRPYRELVFQPMLELLDFLRIRDFQIYLVTGSTGEFMRSWAEEIYRIPRQNILGSAMTTFASDRTGKTRVHIGEGVAFLNDGPAKALLIERHIGRRPILACGNSDGDLDMLRLAASASPHWTALIHHTDSEREFAYDSEALCGRLHRGLHLASDEGWRLVDMKTHWSTIHPPCSEPAARSSRAG